MNQMKFNKKTIFFTHSGVLNKNKKPFKTIKLRETGKLWITENGMPYSKTSGRMRGEDSFDIILDINSIKKLETAIRAFTENF